MHVSHPTDLCVLCQLVDRGVAAIWSFYEGSVRLGKMTRVQMKNTMARLSPSIRYDDAKHADIASINWFFSFGWFCICHVAIRDIAT